MFKQVRLVTLGAVVLLGACTQVMERSKHAAEVTKPVIDDTRKTWEGLFDYRPDTRVTQLPQTRYCYNTLTDIVCYDSAQAGTTSHLNGYQDGENISWVQQGGGSLGVSGGEATAQVGADHPHIAPNAKAVASASSSEVTVTNTLPPPTPQSPKASGPFYSKESPYVK